MKTKKCSRCKSIKGVPEFNKNSTRKDGLADACKKCTREYGRKHYLKNKAYYIEKSDRAIANLRRRLRELKSSIGCSKCQEKHPACLQFHHRDKNNKSFEICDAVFTRSWKKIEEEMAKCDILCANCHAKEHFKLNGNIWPPECNGLTRAPAKG